MNRKTAKFEAIQDTPGVVLCTTVISRPAPIVDMELNPNRYWEGQPPTITRIKHMALSPSDLCSKDLLELKRDDPNFFGTRWPSMCQ
uniref:Uncharacterized protein n=1 Tax=Anguilla anguilla TaxID=7936 RepID=A0A0E9T928_ANGAN